MGKTKTYVAGCHICETRLAHKDCLDVTLRSGEPNHYGGGEGWMYHKTCFAKWLHPEAIVLPALPAKEAKEAIKTLSKRVLNELTANLPLDQEVLCIFCNGVLTEKDSVAIDLSNDESKRSHPCVKKTYFCCKACARRTWPTEGYTSSYLLTTAEMNEILGIKDGPVEPSAATTEPKSLFQKIEQKRYEPANAFEESLERLLNQLEAIGKEHGELYDTDCREQMSAAIMKRFLVIVKGSRMPKDFGMFSDKGNSMVREALNEFVKVARKQINSGSLKSFRDRLQAFQNEKIVSTKERFNYEEFFGHFDPECYSETGEANA